MDVAKIKSLKMSDKDWFLEECLPRFGSMNKNDYEVALFTLLLRNGYSQMSDFDISRELKITETKVKRLRYESNLVYPNNEDLNEQLKNLLNNAKYRMAGSNKIQFLVKDKMLRSYASKILEEQGGFIDSSFNSDIVSVNPEDMILLLSVVYSQNSKATNDTLMIIKSELQKSKKPLDKTLKDNAMNVLKGLAKVVAPACVNLLIEYLEAL